MTSPPGRSGLHGYARELVNALEPLTIDDFDLKNRGVPRRDLEAISPPDLRPVRLEPEVLPSIYAPVDRLLHMAVYHSHITHMHNLKMDRRDTKISRYRKSSTLTAYQT